MYTGDDSFKKELSPEEKAIYEKYSKMQPGNIIIKGNKTGFLSVSNPNIKFNPFQYKPILKLLTSGKRYVYIADEVGVGKTYETGIAITELMYNELLRKDADILIVCPNMLCRKWMEVLKNAFGLPSHIAKSFSEIFGISIMSFNSLSKIKEDNPSVEINMIVVDEAHKISETQAKWILALRERCKNGYTIMLSATPLDGKDVGENNVENQYKILTGSDANLEEAFFKKESDCLCRTLKRDIRDGSVTCHVINHEIENEVLLKFHKLCKHLFNHHSKLLRYAPLNAIASSPACAKDFLDFLIENSDEKQILGYFYSSQTTDEGYSEENEEFVSEGEEFDDEEDEFDQKINGLNQEVEASFNDNIRVEALKKEIAKLLKEKLVEIRNLLEKQTYDPKLEALRNLIKENRKKAEEGYTNPDDETYVPKEAKFYKKIVVFTNFIKTSEYLYENLKDMGGVKINGGVDDITKWTLFNQFRKEDSGKDILIITNVACEGQDMDFCNSLVNYDLSYNPVVLEQRKGRIDRFEVKKNNIFVHNFRVSGFDPTGASEGKPDSIYRVLERKLKGIETQTGIYYSVIEDAKGVQEVSEEWRNEVCETLCQLFANYFGNNITDFPKDEGRNGREWLKAISEFLTKNACDDLIKKTNILFEQYGITVSLGEDNKISFSTAPENIEFLKSILIGGTLASNYLFNT